MESISGFARIMAKVRVQAEATKPFFGKPYIKYGQMLWLGAYFVQIGALIGSKYSRKLDAVGTAFLGATGEPGAVARFCKMAYEANIDLINKSSTFFDFVRQELMKRHNFQGDEIAFFVTFGMIKVKTDAAAEYLWQCAKYGFILGAIDSEKVRAMFEQMHGAFPKENWDKARSYGLDIPEKQDIISYEEAERDENALFMEYCQECCPELYIILIH